MTAQWDVFCAAVTLTSANNTIVFQEDGAGSLSVDIPAGTYYANASNEGLIDAISDALNDESTLSGTGAAYTLSWLLKTSASTATARLTISTDGTSIKILSSGTTFDLTQIGFPQADSSTAAAINSSLSPTVTWLPNAPYVISPAAKTMHPVKQHEAVDGTRYTYDMASRTRHRLVRFDNIVPERTWESESSSDPARTFEAFTELCSDGRTIRLYRDSEASAGTLNAITSADLIATYVQEMEDGNEWVPSRRQGGVPLYTWSWRLVEQ